MKKIVINACHGGFGLSELAIEKYKKLTNNTNPYFYDLTIPRDCFLLIKLVEELGEDVNNRFSNLKIVEIPDDVDWEIAEYDGFEWVAEMHRTWSWHEPEAN
jgi:hypothetical protein